ncbi:MAG: PAS domain S-box protein [Phycisphaerae bacterium]
MRWALVDFCGRCACHAKDVPPTENVFDRVPTDARADLGRALAISIREGSRQTVAYSDGTATRALDIEPLRLGNVDGPLALITWRDGDVATASGEQLARLSRRNHAILQSAMDGFFVVDNQYRFLEVNDAFCRMLGYSAEELQRMRITDLEVPEEHESAGYSSKTGIHQFDGAHRHKFGHIVYLELSINVLNDEGRKILVGFARDVTERRKSEEDVTRLSRQQRLILEAVEEGIVGLDREGRVSFVNSATARLLQTPPGRLIGRGAHDFFCGDDSSGDCDTRDCPLCNVLSGARRSASAESEFRRLDGTRFAVEFTINSIYDGATLIGAVLVFKDLTAQRQAREEREHFEKQMQQSQRLESLGLLAGGIAHDLNNMLVGILGNACLAQSQLADQAAARDRLQRIVSNCERASRVIRQILAYSGQVSCDVTVTDLNELIESIIELARVGSPRSTQIDMRLEPATLLVKVDTGQMQQVVMNLVVNAVEAIGERAGKISITTRRMQISPHDARRLFPGQELPGEACAAIIVEDDGCGMSAETMQHIFEPFFSKKGAGRGLGLSAIHGIVRAHRGAIRVESEVGKGTRFTIALPLSAQLQAIEPTPPPLAPSQTDQRGQTILVIDDEAEVRDVIEQMLRSDGHQTMVAEDGHIGVEMFCKHADEIDVVLLDMTMPGKSGAEVYREILDVRPDATIVVSSGYSEESIPSRLGTNRSVPFLPKPFTKHALLQKIGDAVEQSRRATVAAH